MHNVSLQVLPGERVGIRGDNGCGKSTVVKLLLGYARPTSADSRVYMHGLPVSWKRPYPFLGYVGDPGHNTFELGLPLHGTVGSLLRIHASLAGSQLLVDESRALGDLLNLPQLLPLRLASLSSGERKRVMLYLALALRRRLLILDEPTDGLDSSVVHPLIDFLKHYADRMNSSLVYISHRREETAYLTDRVLVLDRGSLNADTAHSVSISLRRDDTATPLQGELSLDKALFAFTRTCRTLQWTHLDCRLSSLKAPADDASTSHTNL
ncbi:MAG: ATP-binding cassette domain-containing protein [Hyphomicrobiales bacterium]|nr:ATP-binding cassette domain-containing protein [Hyphomicrobiales bacterium]